MKMFLEIIGMDPEKNIHARSIPHLSQRTGA
jgi:hypothetical protein